jgi:hypothetical protein
MSYAYGEELSAADRQKAEKHIAPCADCTEMVGFLRTSIKNARTGPQPSSPGEPCPEPALIVAWEADTLDAPASEHVSAHIVHCDSCREEYLTLLRWSNERVEERALVGDPDLEAEIVDGLRDYSIRTGANVAVAEGATFNWGRAFEKAKRWVLDLHETYQNGTSLGPIRIVAQTFATRGKRGSLRFSKQVEMSVGENTYSIQLGVQRDGSFQCDIDGHKITDERPLHLAVRRDTGEALFLTKTNIHGNGAFVLPTHELPPDILVLDLYLDGHDSQIAVRLPG